MTLRRVVVTAIAEQDVRDIAAYIATDNRNAARRFGAEFTQAVERVGTFPGTGHPLLGDDRAILGMRVSSRFNRYILIYKQTEEGAVHVLRVVHGARDIQAILERLV